ncbi:hypothetical protein BJ170DRAFT_631839 [Xylariales sp. AK1849]|nr:hypothetical protein BJ170DRAFT_631839 [Xylariales sp. AK1849]
MPRKLIERKRRVHSRSRNGCVTCKTKHLRCDEKMPLCTRCLSSGGICGYQSQRSVSGQYALILDVEDDFDNWNMSISHLSTPNHMFVSYPVEMTYESRFLFDIFARYRSVVNRDVSPHSHAFLVERALSSPALLHGALLLSATRWTWYSGSINSIEKSFLHHKLQAIKFVNERLQDPQTAATETTIASIASLAMAESGLGRREIATAHLNGLSEILAMRGDAPSERNNLLQSMISSTSQGLRQMPIHEIHSITQSIKTSPATGCFHTFQLFVDPFMERYQQDPRVDHKTLADFLMDQTEDEDQQGGWTTPPSEAESRARFSSCCFRLWTMLGAGDSDIFLLNWFVEALIDDICMTERGMLRGAIPRHLWFWAAMMARCAATSARPTCASEAQQIDEWKDIACGKIRLATEALNIKSWEEAKVVLKSWLWRDTLTDDQRLMEMWEEAVMGKETILDEAVSPECLDSRLFAMEE